MIVDTKHVNHLIWRVRYWILSHELDEINEISDWCTLQFGSKYNGRRWNHVIDAHVHRFWFYNCEDYTLFNLVWLNNK